jgi:mannose/fructose/N-acetylgalactosamine-specific phosphotransferase system component IIB
MAVPDDVEVLVNSVEEFSENYFYSEKEGKKTIVLFCGVYNAFKPYRSGFEFEELNIGNMQSEENRRYCTPAVYLCEEDIKNLQFLVDSGVKVELRCVARDKPLDFRDMMKKITLP